MKRICILILILSLLAAGTACAAVDDTAFAAGKQALSLMSYGEYAKALETMGACSDEAAVREAEDAFSGCFSGSVQTAVAVLYQRGGSWFLAIPLLEPADDSVSTAVFKLTEAGCDGVVCRGWGEVMEDVDAASSVTWQDEYSPSGPILMKDE